MRNQRMEYPHPVLNEYTDDYPGSEFRVELPSDPEDNGDDLIIHLRCHLACDGLSKMVDAGDAKVVVRLTCYRTSLRETFEASLGKSVCIRIPKKDVAEALGLQAMIVAARAVDDFQLAEFNQDYFAGMVFHLRKGDILADVPELDIKLDTVLEKNMASIVWVYKDAQADRMKAYFPQMQDINRTDLGDYIRLMLPEHDYTKYENMRKKRYWKNSTERIIQAALIFPVITEAVSRLRDEELLEGSDGDSLVHYKGTVWADSMREALRRRGYEDLANAQETDCEIANLLLGDVCSDALGRLMQNLEDWFTAREEEPGV